MTLVRRATDLSRLSCAAATAATLALLVQRTIVPLEPGRPIVVGRAASCDVRVDAPGVAPRHASFERVGDAVVVSDLAPGPTLGVSVRGERRATHYVDGDAAVALGREPALIARVSDRAAGAITWHGIVAADGRSLEMLEAVARVATTRAPVWLAGESGTGKEGTARAIHAESARCDGPYVALNCAALPEALAEAELFGAVKGAYTGSVRARAGAFVQAHRGTLLLDEVGELAPAIQAKLLRALESGEVLPVGADRPVKVDVRIIASTWRDLRHEAELGRFRHDLLHRLWVLRLDLPPLRERPADVVALVRHLFVAAGHPELVPSDEMLRLVARRPWPGNVRELKNAVERAVAFYDPLELLPRDEDGPKLPRRVASDTRQALEPGIDGLIRNALKAHGNHRGRAAQALGVSRSTFYRRWREAREACGPGRVDTPIAPFMMAQASVSET